MKHLTLFKNNCEPVITCKKLCNYTNSRFKLKLSMATTVFCTSYSDPKFKKSYHV